MSTSLRFRLWLTYAVLVGFVLAIIGTGVLVFLIRNPLRLRMAYQQMQMIAIIIQQRQTAVDIASPDRLRSALENTDKAFNVRVILLNSKGQLIADSRNGLVPPIPSIPLPKEINTSTESQFRDPQGRFWLYVARKFNSGDTAIIAIPRSRARLPQIFQEAVQDDLFKPMIQAGLIALLVSLLLAFWISRWVVAPLRRVAQAAHSVASGDYHAIPVEGPNEVQELEKAFNEMTERVKTGQKSQRDFVANVSHELKTPLTSIQGFAQAIFDGTANSPEALQQSASVIYSEAERMNRLVMELLDLARLDSGIANLERSPVDLGSLLQGVFDKLTPQASQAKVHLQAQVTQLPPLIGDGDRLAQVFTNLVENAIKFTPEEGQVSLAAHPSDSQVEVAVSDTGQGIPEAELSHIFDRFYQVDKSRQGGSSHGVGLGLAIAREIVIAHHGSISAFSTLGKGSTFVVKIPFIGADEPASVKRK